MKSRTIFGGQIFTFRNCSSLSLNSVSEVSEFYNVDCLGLSELSWSIQGTGRVCIACVDQTSMKLCFSVSYYFRKNGIISSQSCLKANRFQYRAKDLAATVSTNFPCRSYTGCGEV
ncbi:Hypothetical_protein [Hexamita inflata]|uniref:Hypothetical_protein n=1 Tax=Hexamita inflata TaxID=28002 RepID=A0AA86NSS7_9EUKA|nr:Hypothetical protein HINF_LOCUS11900 [Hexamita inflata]